MNPPQRGVILVAEEIPTKQSRSGGALYLVLKNMIIVNALFRNSVEE
jgi:hypothetical protein